MIFGNVERDKVVPGIFDFRAFGRLEAHSPHDLHQVLNGLGDRMDVADRGRIPGRVGSKAASSDPVSPVPSRALQALNAS